jgi:hypothetical protein
MNTNSPCIRAARLRDQAADLPAPMATAYRRRAAELELQAHLIEAMERVAVAA